MNALEKRIIDISYRHSLTHVSSCLNTVNLLSWIYDNRNDNEPVILGNGHAGLALYVVLESKGLCDAEKMVEKHGVHPNRDMEHGIWCSSGSLGQAETIAVGMALADKTRTVWLVTSDGACMEGSVYEALRTAEKYALNLKAYAVCNGLGAYGEISLGDLPVSNNLNIEIINQSRYPEWLRGLQGHYLKLSKEQHAELMA